MAEGSLAQRRRKCRPCRPSVTSSACSMRSRRNARLPPDRCSMICSTSAARPATSIPRRSTRWVQLPPKTISLRHSSPRCWSCSTVAVNSASTETPRS
ncbi:MAG: hypothetical protein IJ918_19375 [Sphingobium sp.]|nr:hypothetical protein [Sphingobium sp.]